MTISKRRSICLLFAFNALLFVPKVGSAIDIGDVVAIPRTDGRVTNARVVSKSGGIFVTQWIENGSVKEKNMPESSLQNITKNDFTTGFFSDRIDLGRKGEKSRITFPREFRQDQINKLSTRDQKIITELKTRDQTWATNGTYSHELRIARQNQKLIERLADREARRFLRTYYLSEVDKMKSRRAMDLPNVDSELASSFKNEKLKSLNAKYEKTQKDCSEALETMESEIAALEASGIQATVKEKTNPVNGGQRPQATNGEKKPVGAPQQDDTDPKDKAPEKEAKVGQ